MSLLPTRAHYWNLLILNRDDLNIDCSMQMIKDHKNSIKIFRTAF